MNSSEKTLVLISFTDRGDRINRKLTKTFCERGYRCLAYSRHKAAQNNSKEEPSITLSCAEGSLSDWTKHHFSAACGLIFIGAAGIAVRAIAPCLRDKFTDPAVVVVDELGTFAISLLSGHVGEANKLAYETAEILNGVPVVTTATDLNKKFAVDVFAKENHLFLSDRTLAKEISSEILKGHTAGVFSDYPLIIKSGTTADGQMPPELSMNCACGRNFWITRSRKIYDNTLKLVPKILHLGIGCRKGTSFEAIYEAFLDACRTADCMPEGFRSIASIDLKKEEPGILALADHLQIPYHTYPVSILSQTPGEYEESDFVSSVTGIGNVCERAAVQELSHTGGKIVLKKQRYSGITIAITEETWEGVLRTE